MAYTPECLHGMHSACACENACSCCCHLLDLIERDEAAALAYELDYGEECLPR